MSLRHILNFAIAVALLGFGGAFAKNWQHSVGKWGSGTKGSGDLVTQERTVEAFSRIETNLSVEMVVEVGKPQAVSLSFDDNLIDFIRTEVDGKTLVIDTEESFSSRNSVQIKVSVPAIDLIMTEGSGVIDVHNLNNKKFRIILSGSGDVHLDGTSEFIDIEINGSGDVDATELAAGDVAVTINGSGAARVAATGSLDAEVNGSGDVLYTGKPEAIYSSVNGSGKIRKIK